MVVRSSVRPGRGTATLARGRVQRTPRLRAGAMVAPVRRGRGAELLALGARFINDHDLVPLKLMLLGGLIVMTALFERII